ncbi:MAG: hypothetical protein KVP17_001160 [Porospora cf. gigantea B]|uniref:uncharacterized protein n=1 Tax=Porospora cf. gigantea B TaxID=2853592 RepID=UPI003571FAB3|nr:MAG: hypothetical protein KVP17_001160 [Porospora cf. gigantea B]
MFRGVTYNREREAYRAECKVKGRQVYKDFSVAKCGGHKEAQEAAVEERLVMEAEDKKHTRRPSITKENNTLQRTLVEYVAQTGQGVRQTTLLEFTK